MAHQRSNSPVAVRALALIAIVLGSAAAGTLVAWRAPGLDLYARDWLMRARGPLALPDDIAIVAIDEQSIARFSRFPWPRSVTARAIDALAAAQPKAIAVDVLYTDPTQPDEDAALARSIAQAGNVVVAAQLVDSPAGGAPEWLLPLDAIARVAAATGHVNVSTEADGVGRQVLARESDNHGQAFRAMAVEAVRVGERIPAQAVEEMPGTLLLGKRAIPLESGYRGVILETRPGAAAPVVMLPAGRLAIDYAGPAGSFAPRTYSLAHVLDGTVPASAFRGKYVLVGATAASLGDRLASPFVHQPDARADQHGALMPGVEVLANSLNTILRGRFFRETPEWLAFLLACAIAAATLALLSAAQGRHEGLKQTGAILGLAGGVVGGEYLLYTNALVFPPLAQSLVAFAAAGVMGLLRRSLATSSRLDATIAEIARSGDTLAPTSEGNAVAEAVARLTGAAGVAIFAGRGEGLYQLTATSGLAVQSRLNSGRKVALPLATPKTARFFETYDEHAFETVLLPVEGTDEHSGVLVLAQPRGIAAPADSLLVAAALARGACAAPSAETAERPSWWPRGVEWKAGALARLNTRMLERARFLDLALRSVEDGLIIASADGRIAFANPRAAEILGSTHEALTGRDLLERLAAAEATTATEEAAVARRGTLARLLLDRAAIEREIAIRGPRTHYYTLRLAAVAGDGGPRAPVLGLVASLSDITRQKELQKTKDDVVALVSHEMRTPLTAIQGMSELLAQYEMPPERRREMYQAINEESKRLARMTGDYLDIARLESGATQVRRSPVKLDATIERAVLLLAPLAAEKRIRIEQELDPALRPLVADADLLARAVSNLVGNAIKYSPADTTITIAARAEDDAAVIEVKDHGYGISSADLERIFDKFYRVPRVEDAGTPGTGLGLALVREIAELHGGTITVASRVNEGSVFRLRIPINEN